MLSDSLLSAFVRDLRTSIMPLNDSTQAVYRSHAKWILQTFPVLSRSDAPPAELARIYGQLPPPRRTVFRRLVKVAGDSHPQLPLAEVDLGRRERSTVGTLWPLAYQECAMLRQVLRANVALPQAIRLKLGDLHTTDGCWIYGRNRNRNRVIIPLTLHPWLERARETWTAGAYLFPASPIAPLGIYDAEAAAMQLAVYLMGGSQEDYDVRVRLLWEQHPHLGPMWRPYVRESSKTPELMTVRHHERKTSRSHGWGGFWMSRQDTLAWERATDKLGPAPVVEIEEEDPIRESIDALDGFDPAAEIEELDQELAMFGDIRTPDFRDQIDNIERLSRAGFNPPAVTEAPAECHPGYLRHLTEAPQTYSEASYQAWLKARGLSSWRPGDPC